MSRVFVPEAKQLNEVMAAKHGQIVPLVPVETKLGLEPDRIKSICAKPLMTFDDDDLLLLDGTPIHCAVAISILSVMRESIPVLIWSSQARMYLARELILNNIPDRSAVYTGDRKVFLANDVHDYSKVGYKSISLTTGNDPDIMEPDKVKENMIPLLKDSQMDDFLLISGSKTHNAVASAIMAVMHQKVNYLIWNAKTQDYVMRSCKYDIDNLERICRT